MRGFLDGWDGDFDQYRVIFDRPDRYDNWVDVCDYCYDDSTVVYDDCDDCGDSSIVIDDGYVDDCVDCGDSTVVIDDG